MENFTLWIRFPFGTMVQSSRRLHKPFAPTDYKDRLWGTVKSSNPLDFLNSLWCNLHLSKMIPPQTPPPKLVWVRSSSDQLDCSMIHKRPKQRPRPLLANQPFLFDITGIDGRGSCYNTHHMQLMQATSNKQQASWLGLMFNVHMRYAHVDARATANANRNRANSPYNIQNPNTKSLQRYI